MSKKKDAEQQPPAEDEVPVEIVRDEDDATVDGAAQRIQELEERLKRVQAEFVNETKRIQRQAEDSRKFAIERVVHDLLPVFDALHSARQGLDQASGEDSSKAMKEGLDLVERELLSALGRHGVSRIEAHEAPFDPSQHEALYVIDHESLPAGTVAQVLRPGFTLHGRVVRAAHVAVTKAAEAGAQGDDAQDEEE